MGDAENNFQPSKKRAAGVQLSRDNPDLDDNEDTSEQESGTFKRASDEVLATRRIVRVRRQQTTPTTPDPSPASNLFAAIRLVPPASSAPPVEAVACSGKSKESEQIDESKSENKVDEPKSESFAEEENTVVNDENAKQSESKVDDPKPEPNAQKDKNVVNDENAKQSESKVDDPKPEPNAQKDETDNVSELDTAKSMVDKVAEGGNSGDGVKEATTADNSVTEARKQAEEEGNDEEKQNAEATAEKNAEPAPFSSFRQLSSTQNAFSGFAGTGFSGTSFSFGSIPKDGSSLGSSTFGLKSDQPTFGFGVSNNGNSSIFGSSGDNKASKSEGSKFPPMQEVPVETGEENEKAVLTADSVLFEYIDGAWKERGKGELKVNVSTTGTGKARLVMRARGNYRLILNASLFPDMKLTNMDKKGITFACVNSASEGKDGLSTIALKFKDASIVEDFRAAVMEHKAKPPVVALKTPENSPKASDE
ncbi:nuclear pore complex protein NUP50A-like [Sesamum indicum]|uniref:Nuclear pore complex protein NUP50A-like n=1 Tax=Sesamum indicum TaxID=4182 RepID=A0A6I9SSP8_SESIN|nr:nuclear pore complex protein NUP50A-like [Sesamum indicum]XP_011072321.1 nuclear pore complex protein NUP50A-like [Sesamum indicum]